MGETQLLSCIVAIGHLRLKYKIGGSTLKNVIALVPAWYGVDRDSFRIYIIITSCIILSVNQVFGNCVVDVAIFARFWQSTPVQRMSF